MEEDQRYNETRRDSRELNLQKKKNRKYKLFIER